MSAPRTVYAATSGSYSDYTVVAIFENREDADWYVAIGMAEDVEEMTLHSERPVVYTEYQARINTQGKPWGPVGALSVQSFRTLEEPKYRASADAAYGFVASGPDRERVVKSVTDRYAAWKARQVGIA